MCEPENQLAAASSIHQATPLFTCIFDTVFYLEVLECWGQSTATLNSVPQFLTFRDAMAHPEAGAIATIQPSGLECV